MPGPGLRLRRLHCVGQGLVEVAVVSHRGVPVLARDEVPFGDGDDEGAGVAVEGSGAEEVEALRVFFLGGQEREERKRCQRQFLSDFSSLSLSHPPPQHSFSSSSPPIALFFLTDHRLCASSPTEG